MVRLRLLVLVFLGLWLLASYDCRAQSSATPTYSETVLYNFCQTTGCADGALPFYGNLILARDGNLYGVTSNGGNSSSAECGNYGCGTVFRISPTGVFTTLYAFCSINYLEGPSCDDGVFPTALIQGNDGDFYGTTEEAGLNGSGTFFRLTPAGVLTTLYSFCNQADCTDGRGPSAPPIQGSDGNFYGTTIGGGSSGCGGDGCGTIFKITPSGTLTTLYRFCSLANCADGAAPYAFLTEGPDGNFYGTTSGWSTGAANGANDPGQTVFKVTPTGTLTTLYTFCSESNCTDGWSPTAALLLASDGNFYGTTGLGGTNSSQCNGYGCGTVYKISASGTFSSLYSFCDATGCSLGNQPQFGLIQGSDGSFYGAALSSANLSAGGTVYKISPSGDASLVYAFCSETDCTDGANPFTMPIQAADGALYGMTDSGGPNAVPTNNLEAPQNPCPPNLEGCGTVYKITSSPAITSAVTGPIQLSLSQSAINLGSSVALNWSVSNAFSLTMQQCNAFVQGGMSGAGAWTGAQSGTLSGGLYSGQATLTPTADGTYTYALVCGGIESGFATLTVGTISALSITTATLPNGTLGQSYSAALSATGGVPPYSWSIASGNLPAGLTLNGSTGAISGTPSQPGTENFVVQVADSESTPMTATASLALTIPAPAPTLTAGGGSSTINITAPGQSGTVQLAISGFSSNSISFSCDGLPSGASCSFSSVMGSGNSGTVTMTVTTTAPSTGATDQAVRLAGLSLPAILMIAVLSRRRKRDLYLLAFVLMLGLGLNGCGGGGNNASNGGGGGGNPGTPAGTTTLTVTATSGSQSAQMTVSLIVQ